MAHADESATTAPLIDSPETEKTKKPRRNMYAFACATLASMTTILMGYNLALMSGAQLFIREDLGLTDEQVEVLSGSMNVFMLASILAAGPAADLLGRRGTLVLANAFLMAGALAMSLGGSYAALLAARFVTSLGVGFALVVAPVYNAEISPASARGVLSSLLDIFVNVGILLSYVSNWALAGLPLRLGWRVMFGIGALPPVLLAVAVLAVMPESPRWLAMRGRESDARAVLLRVSDTATEAELRLDEIKQAVAFSETIPKPSESSRSSSSTNSNVWKELVLRPTPTVKRALVCVIGLNFLQQAAGVDAILLYSPVMFKKAGMSSNESILGATVAIGVVKTCFIGVVSLFSDRVGRRPLLLLSSAGVAASLTALALTLSFVVPGSGDSSLSVSMCVGFTLVAVAFFSCGFGSLPSTVSAEIMPLRLRAQGSSLGMAANRVTCGAVTMSFLSLAGWISMPGCFLLYAGLAATACVFVFLRLPETRGRSLEDMDVLFSNSK